MATSMATWVFTWISTRACCSLTFCRVNWRCSQVVIMSKCNHWSLRKYEAGYWFVCNHFEIVKQDSLYSSVQRMVCEYHVELLLVRAPLWDRCFIFSGSCFRVCALYPRLSKKEAISWGLFRKSAWSEQMRRRRRSWLYGRLSLQWRGCDESYWR